MPHAIQQINDAIMVKLTGLATTGNNVFSGRVYALERNEVPCLLVSTGDETSQYDGFGGPRRLDRRVDLLVECVASVNSSLEQTLNTIQSEVEVALAADTKLGGTVMDVAYSGRTKFLSGDGEKKFGVMRLTYTIAFQTDEGSPDTLIPA